LIYAPSQQNAVNHSVRWIVSNLHVAFLGLRLWRPREASYRSRFRSRELKRVSKRN
jgi:hypothetical protein